MRRGFSLIELVFAIVIIAITLITIPTLLGESVKSNAYTLVQESLLAARTKLGNILSYPWDQNSPEYDNGSLKGSYILDVINGDDELDCITNGSGSRLNRRRGEPDHDRKRHFAPNQLLATFAVDFDPNSNEPDDIDDFDNQTSSITIISDNGLDTNDTDYISDNLLMKSDIYYVNDSVNYSDSNITFSFDTTHKTKNANQSTNIKMVVLTVHSDFMDQNFTLRSFSCNIGSNLLSLYSNWKP